MKHWIIKYTSLYKEPKVGIKICDLPARSVVTVLNEYQSIYTKVKFRNFVGWVYNNYLEEIVEEFPRGVVQIDNPTPEDYDAAQYIIYNGNTQYNLCGEMCVAYIFGDSVENFLEVWKAKPNSYFQRVFGTGKARGTNAEELKDMVKVYANSATLYAQNALHDTMSSRVLLSPARLRNWLEDGWKYIASVKISGVTGELQPTGILHWVTITKITPDGIGRGWVELYNPFPNQKERYSWKEFVASAGNPYGIFVKQL